MQDIREIMFRDSRSNANNKICFEIRATALRPAFTQKDFYYVHTRPSIKGPSPRNYNSTLGVHYSSLNHNHLYTRGIGTKPKLNHLYTRGIGTKPKLNHLYTRGTRHKAKPQSPLYKRDRHKAKTQSPLHKRDNAQSQSTITSTQEG